VLDQLNVASHGQELKTAVEKLAHRQWVSSEKATRADEIRVMRRLDRKKLLWGEGKETFFVGGNKEVGLSPGRQQCVRVAGLGRA